MKIVTSERTGLVLADGQALEQLMGRDSLGGISVTNDRATSSGEAVVAVAIDDHAKGRKTAPRHSVELKGRVEISQEAFLIAESKAFLIEAMTTRDDRLALFSHAVLRYMVEAGHAATSSGGTNER